MAFPIFYQGGILFRNGTFATSTECCCVPCCDYTEDEIVQSLQGTYGDIELIQTGASSSLLASGGCFNQEDNRGIKWTVPVRLTDQLGGIATYTTTATIRLLAPGADGCRWEVTIPQDPSARPELAHNGSFIAAASCAGLQDVNTPGGDNGGPGGAGSGWAGTSGFIIVDPDGSAEFDSCHGT